MRDDDSSVIDPPSTEGSVLNGLSEKETIEKLLEGLEPCLRFVVKVCILEGQTMKVCAHLLGVHPATVKQWRNDALKEIRKILHLHVNLPYNATEGLSEQPKANKKPKENKRGKDGTRTGKTGGHAVHRNRRQPKGGKP